MIILTSLFYLCLVFILAMGLLIGGCITLMTCAILFCTVVGKDFSRQERLWGSGLLVVFLIWCSVLLTIGTEWLTACLRHIG